MISFVTLFVHYPLNRFFFSFDFLDSDIMQTGTDKMQAFDMNLKVIDILCDLIFP